MMMNYQYISATELMNDYREIDDDAYNVHTTDIGQRVHCGNCVGKVS